MNQFPKVFSKFNLLFERGDQVESDTTDRLIVIKERQVKWMDYFDLYFQSLLHSELTGSFKLTVLNQLEVKDKEVSSPVTPSQFNQRLPISTCTFLKKYKNMEGYLPNEKVLSRLTQEERLDLDVITNKKKYIFYSRFNDPIFSMVDVEKKQITKQFVGHKGTVLDIKCLFQDPYNMKSKGVGEGTFYTNTTSSSFNNRVLSASSDSTIKVWNFSTGNCIDSFIDHKGSVVSLQIIDESTICSGSHDLSVKMWDVNIGKCVATIENVHERLLYKIQYNTWNNLLSTCGKDGKIKLFDLRTISKNGKPLKVIEHKKPDDDELLSVYSIAMNSHSLSCGGKQGLFNVFDLRNLDAPIFSKNYSSSIDRIYNNELQVTLFEGFNCKVIDLCNMEEKHVNVLDFRQATYCLTLGSDVFVNYNTMITQVDNQDLCMVDFE